MTEKANKIDLSKILYILGAELYVALKIIGDANFNAAQEALFSKINSILSVFLLLLLIGSLVSQVKKISNKKIYFILFFIVLEVVIKAANGPLLPLSLFLLIAAYPASLDIKRFAYYTYLTMFISILLVMVGFWSGVLSDSIIYRNSLIRHSLGFVTANSYANKIIILLFIRLCYSWNKKWKWPSILIWVLLIGYTYFYANSRASFYFGILVMILIFAKRYHLISKIISKVIFKLPIILFSINACMTLGGMLYFSSIQNNLYYLINNLVSGRLNFITLFYQMYGLNLWGTRNIEFVSWREASRSFGLSQWFGMDNSYAYIAIVNGVVVLVLFGIMYYMAQKEAYNDKNLGMAIYLCLFAIMGLTENYMSNYALNFSIFIFAAFLSSNKKTEVESVEVVNGQ